MKKIIKIGLILIVCAVIGITLGTATSNDKLPTQTEVTSFLSGVKGSSPSDILDKIKEDHSTWNADLLSCGDKEALAVYYTDSGSKGYGGIYYNETGIVTPGDLRGYTVKESYKGELEESTNETENNTSNPAAETNSTVIKDDETEKNSNLSYASFKTALDNYDGKTSCTSQSCAQSLSDYFKGLGWGTEVKYCVAVNTSDEGTVYVVLGV